MMLVQLVLQQIINLILSLVFLLSSFLIGRSLLLKKIKINTELNFLLFLLFGFFVHYTYNLFLSLIGSPSRYLYLLPTVLIILKIMILNPNDIKELISKIFVELTKINDWANHYKLIFIIESIYVLSYVTTYFRGVDLSIYHLAVPDRILSNLKLIPNADSFSAGIPFAWHVTNTPMFLIGGETSYLAINFWIFQILLLSLVPIGIKIFGVKNTPQIEPLAITLIGAYLIFTLNGSITNTDLISIFIEISSILILLRFRHAVSNGNFFWIIFGVVVGYCFSVKFTTVFTIILICLLILFDKKIRVINKFLFLTACSIVSSFWIIYNKIFYDYFIAVSFNSQADSKNIHILNESIQELVSVYAKWYSLNSNNLIAGSLLLIPICAIISLGGLLKFGYSKLQKSIIVFGILHYLVLIILVPRADIVFHDRYHIMTYIVLIIFSIITIDKFIEIKSRLAKICITFLISSLIIGSFWENTIKFPTLDKYEIKSENIYKQSIKNFSLLQTRYKSIKLEDEKNPIPIGAKVATNSIAPYSLHRNFMQVLPFVTQSINLDKSSYEIACELIQNDTRYLVLFPSASTIPGTELIIEKYLVEIRNVNKVYGVEPITEVLLGEDEEVISGTYYLDPEKIGCL
jgi:hypothetical protein